MKSNLMLTLLVSAFVSVQAYAQNAPASESTQADTRRERMASRTPEERAERQTAQMKQQLSLTADQEKTVAAINLKYVQQNQKLMASGDRNAETMKQMRDAMEARDGELKSALTKEQYQQYETMRNEQRNRMRDGRGQGNNRK
jgi:hypothetical protein